MGFVHIDCDIYDSAREVLHALRDRMAQGAVIVFDEFFAYHGFREHEYRAFHEFIAETKRPYRFASYSGGQATVVLDDVTGEPCVVRGLERSQAWHERVRV